MELILQRHWLKLIHQRVTAAAAAAVVVVVVVVVVVSMDIEHMEYLHLISKKSIINKYKIGRRSLSLFALEICLQ